MRHFISLIIILLAIRPFHGMDTGQKVFRSNIRSLVVRNSNNFMAPPVIRLGSNHRLDINFDIIGNNHEYLRYRLIHCNADWQPSRLLESEYLGSFNEFPIDDYAYSTNTYIHYVNYNISLPDPQVPILTAGNYLLQVYPENSPQDVWLQARFSVSSQAVNIDGGLTTRTDKGVNNDYQQLFYSIDTRNLPAVNPYQDFIVTMMQNNRPETLKITSHPLRLDGKKMIFEHQPELIFEASNEYRRFETVRADYPGMHVDSVKFINGIWNAWLQHDGPRSHRNYSYDQTQHGRFKIDEYNSSEPDLSADYVLVHFTLDAGTFHGGNIYVDGDFTNHTFSKENLMKYDWKDGLYHASIPLKQGSYNYQYVVVDDKGKVSTAPIEGNKYETNNEYLINVYLRRQGSRGDELVGTAIL